MIKPEKLFKWGLGELLLIAALLVLFNQYILDEKGTIKADGLGYYDYLPAWYIYGDFPSVNPGGSKIYSDRINNMSFYLDYKGSKLNKYPVGTAVLMFPFFNYAHLTAKVKGFDNDGFSWPYQRAVFYAAVFYLFLALVFLRKLLKLYDIPWPIVFIVQLMAVFSTSLINYVNYDPSFSHVYSFFAISAFLFFTKSYFDTRNIKHLFGAAAFFGLIFILRQINIVIVLFVPFLAGSFSNLKQGLLGIIRKPGILALAVMILLLTVSIQLFLWHYQTGKYLIYSYQGEGFNFLSPAFYSILFSYRKGLFVYAPILFISLFGLLVLLRSRKLFMFWSWLLFFVVLTYLVSSWHYWSYGCSYGSRVFIDFYALFILLLALLFKSMKVWAMIPVILISLTTVPVNIIQTKQYKDYILHWDLTEKQGYWTVFLRTDPKYRGLLWKNTFLFNENTTTLIHSVSLPETTVEPNVIQELYHKYSKQMSDFDRVNIIRVSFDNELSSRDDARIEVNIRDTLTGEIHYYHNHPLIHYMENGLNKMQRGVYNYEFNPIQTQNNCKVSLHIFSGNRPVELFNLKIDFIHYQP